MRIVNGSFARPGPEADLVKEFMGTVLLSPQEGERRIIFIEPKFGVTRPDIVVVDLDPTTQASWPEERLYLEENDLRLVQLLLIEGALTEEKLQIYLPRRLKSSLMRLEKAELIHRINNYWIPRQLKDIFAVRHIITFEAKISALSRALEQAYFNTWFASESYILTTRKTPQDRIIKKAQSHGIGLWMISEIESSDPFLPPKEHPLPQSYGSWIFNELAWKASMKLSL